MKYNTTLTLLNLESMPELSEFVSECITLIILYSDNQIGPERAQALADSQKHNKVHAKLILAGVQELNECMFTCM